MIEARYLGLRLDVICEVAHYGSDYGGWSVCPRLIRPGAVVYSFGVGEDITWDLAMIDHHLAQVWAFDPTPRSAAWVAARQIPPEFRFLPFAVAAHDGPLTLYPPVDPRHVSHSVIPAAGRAERPIQVPARRISSLQNELGHPRVDVMKLDIEGSEYAVLEDLLEGGRLPVQLLVEFHHHLPGIRAAASRRAMTALRAAGYAAFAISRSGHEVSLLYRPSASGSEGER